MVLKKPSKPMIKRKLVKPAKKHKLVQARKRALKEALQNKMKEEKKENPKKEPSEVMNFREVIGPVDMVYTWVDGSDPEWRRKRNQYIKQVGVKSKSSCEENRYRNLDELKYSMRSVFLFAPWIRKIFIVTSGQVPKWLNTEDSRIKMISHDEIFPPELKEKCLPTFNSVAIEANLHRIPGLSEYFLYFNDDVFLGRKVGISDFVDLETGKCRVFLIDKPLEVRKSGYKLSNYNYRDSMSYTQKILNKVLGERPGKTRKALQHLGCCLRKSVMIEVENTLRRIVNSGGKNQFELTCSRFRRNDNMNLITYFYPHYCLAKGYGVSCQKSQGVSISHHHERQLPDILRVRHRMFCLNSLTHVSSDLKKFYKKYYPRKAPWEI